MYLGDIRLGDTIDFKFTSRTFTTGAPGTLSGTPVISAYPGNSTTELTAGITLTVDFDSHTGLNNVRVVASSGNGYATATNYTLVITTGTVGGVSVVGEVVGMFSIEARSALMPTTAARTLVVDAAGLADANTVKIGPTGSGTAQTAKDVGAAVPAAAAGASGGLLINGSNSGTVTLAALTITGVTTFTGATTWTGALTASNASNNFRVNGVAPGASGGLFIAGTNAATTVTTSFTTTFTGNLTGSVASVTGAVGSVTGNVGGNVGGNVTGTIGGLTAAAIKDFFDTDSTTTYASAVAGSVVKEIADNAGGSALTEAGIADAVWDELLSGHAVSGSAGEALSAAGTAGDPWTTALPGAYGSGTAGKIIGDNINATISSRATQTSVDAVDDLVDTEVAAIFSRIGAPVGSSISADIAAAKTDTAAIKVKTDFLPSATAGATGGVFIAGTNAATTITTGLTANITGNLSGSVGSVTGLTASNLDAAISSRMASYTQPTGFLAATFPTTVASTTNITAGTITTVTNLTNAPTAGDFTATMKTSIGTAVAASAVASVTGNVGGNVTGSVGSVTGLTAADVGAIKTKTDSLTFTTAGMVDSAVKRVGDTTLNAAGTGGQGYGA